MVLRDVTWLYMLPQERAASLHGHLRSSMVVYGFGDGVLKSKTTPIFANIMSRYTLYHFLHSLIHISYTSQ